MCFKTNSLNVNNRKDDGQTAYPDEVIRSAGLRDVDNIVTELVTVIITVRYQTLNVVSTSIREIIILLFIV